MATVNAPAAPAGLSTRARALWKRVLEEYELSSAEVELLRNALVSLDRADQAAAIVKAEGITTVDRYGSPKQHPACDVESRSRTLFARIVGQLGVRLTDEQPRRRTSGAKPGPRPRRAPLKAVQ